MGVGSSGNGLVTGVGCGGQLEGPTLNLLLSLSTAQLSQDDPRGWATKCPGHCCPAARNSALW